VVAACRVVAAILQTEVSSSASVRLEIAKSHVVDKKCTTHHKGDYHCILFTQKSKIPKLGSISGGMITREELHTKARLLLLLM
jgi:hypothetical protein